MDVLAICRDLGVGLRLAPADGARRGALIRRGRQWEIVVYRSRAAGASLAPHERFTVAHELGHYALLQESDFRARRRREYWRGEDLCQYFAARLLLPERLLRDLPAPTDTAELMAAVNFLSRRAGVSAEPAARALVAWLDRPVALGTFLLDPYPRTRRLGFRGWWVENRHWWGGGGGRRLAVYLDHPLAPVLELMQSLRVGEVGSPSLEGAATTTLRRRRGTAASFAALLTEA